MGSEPTEEQWETVTMETEQWSQLCEHLELLTLLSLVGGVNTMRTLPPVIHTTSDIEEMGTIRDMELHMLFKGIHYEYSVCTHML